ncbi:unnamed protein product [Rhizoctonia solani]|uniref:Polynucleotide 5'-hydroxyl-kinase GRC3 n=1 Tax=Rhizoctonia solani TaxID=456999 RepID=A0A8H3AYH4_9AGAM|nr:unnamed protein product [Rhizoctonia solani]
MSGGPVLSAVARRRAKIDAAATTTSDPPRAVGDNTGALVDAAPPATGITPSSPLKRKTSARSLRSNGQPISQTIETRSRKRPKAPQPPRGIPATEVPVPLDYPRERPYSPSQPLDVSSSEEDGILPSAQGTPGIGHITPQAAEIDPPVRSVKNIPSLIEMKNYFNLTSEEAYSVTGRRMAARIVLLNEGESLLFVGTMELTLLQGSIRLLGTILTPSRTSHRIFAPRTHPIPVLDALGQPTGTTSRQPNHKRPHLASELPGRIIESVSSLHAVLVLQELVTGVEGLSQVIPTFAGIFEPDNRDKGITERILESVHIYRSESQVDTSFHFPDDWQRAISNILSDTSGGDSSTVANHLCDAPVILVRGAKNSGKSTFSRSLANNLTSRYHKVAFIECDIGQSEFTPGGIVSLNLLTTPIFGPPFTHPSRPSYAHFIGSTSPKTSPSHYLAALSDLAQRYQLEVKYSGSFGDDTTDEELVKNSESVPLVINTQGWVKGMGADLLRSIEDSFAPTHVVEFQSPHITSSLETSHGRPTLFSEESSQNTLNSRSQLIKLPPIVSSSHSTRFSGADLRSLALGSYFYGRLDHKKNESNLDNWVTHWDTSLSLRSTAPTAIDTHSALESIAIVAPAGDDVVPADLPRAIVCGVVGLVAPDSPSTPPETPYIQGALPPLPQNSRCVGLGFIRGASATHLHLITPVPTSQLRLCRILILGELTMPVWAFLEAEGSAIEENGLPFLQWGRSIAEDAGGERRRIRRNIMRRGQV